MRLRGQDLSRSLHANQSHLAQTPIVSGASHHEESHEIGICASVTSEFQSCEQAMTAQGGDIGPLCQTHAEHQ